MKIKPILLTLLSLVVLSLTGYADSIEKLTLSNVTYRASIRSECVFFNIIGKTSLTKTNLEGWTLLKSNLINSGYILTVDKINQMTPVAARIIPPTPPNSNNNVSYSDSDSSSSGTVHVKSYTRQDGTVVKAHTRTLPSRNHN